MNCGHLGPIEGGSSHDAPSGSLGQIAAAIAAGFIRIGTRALIVSGSVVNDEASTTFATALYRTLALGATFGASVHEARRLTHESHIGVTTWGAFHCYGDPNFRMVGAGGEDQDGAADELPTASPAPKGMRRKRRAT